MICTDCQRITMTSVTKDNLVSNQDWETHTYEEHISIPSIVKENCVYLGISQILICPPFYEHSEFWDVILNIIRFMFTEELPQTICARVSTPPPPPHLGSGQINTYFLQEGFPKVVFMDDSVGRLREACGGDTAPL